MTQTVMTLEVMPSLVAETEQVPEPTATSDPLVAIVATAESETFHVTPSERTSDVLSEKVPTAKKLVDPPTFSE